MSCSRNDGGAKVRAVVSVRAGAPLIVRKSLPVVGLGAAVAQPGEPRLGGDAADGVERRAEACAELRREPFGRGGVGRQQQLVVLAPAERRLQVGARGHGNLFEVDLRPDVREVEDVAQIRSQPVREVHHGVDLRPRAEPHPLVDLRHGVAVEGSQRGVEPSGKQIAQSGSRGAQFARCKDHVARAGVAAPLEVRKGGAADGRDVDRDAGFGARRVTPDKRRGVAFGERAVPLDELQRPRLGGIPRKGSSTNWNQQLEGLVKQGCLTERDIQGEKIKD